MFSLQSQELKGIAALSLPLQTIHEVQSKHSKGLSTSIVKTSDVHNDINSHL